VIFVPYPYAAEDHQTVNAKRLVDKHAALMVKDSDAKNVLVQQAIDLALNEAEQQTLRNNIAALAIADADDIIANEILKAI